MILTKEDIKGIEELSTQNFASAGTAAWKILDGYVDEVTNGRDLIIQPENLKINNLLDFLTWKSGQPGISDISILHNKNLVETVNIVNTLASDKRITNVAVENDGRKLMYYSKTNYFTLDIGQIIRGKKIPDNKYHIKYVQISFVTYYEYGISMLIENVKTNELMDIEFVCNKLELM